MKDSQLNIRPLRLDEIELAVEIHQKAFPGFFLSFLGPNFLGLLYRFYVQGATEVALTAEYEGEINGTLIGTVDPRGFYMRLARRHFLPFAAASLRPLLRRPQILPRLLRALLYKGDAPSSIKGGALLASVCVNPDCQGKGTGSRLLAAFESEMWRRGAGFIYLTTDFANNTSTKVFYEKSGWTIESEFTTPEGRPMLRYWKRL